MGSPATLYTEPVLPVRTVQLAATPVVSLARSFSAYHSASADVMEKSCRYTAKSHLSCGRRATWLQGSLC